MLAPDFMWDYVKDESLPNGILLMKFIKNLISKPAISTPLFCLAIFNFLEIPFDDRDKMASHFLSGLAFLFFGLIVLGIAGTKEEKAR